jgi:hypothetical protein
VVYRRIRYGADTSSQKLELCRSLKTCFNCRWIVGIGDNSSISDPIGFFSFTMQPCCLILQDPEWRAKSIHPVSRCRVGPRNDIDAVVQRTFLMTAAPFSARYEKSDRAVLQKINATIVIILEMAKSNILPTRISEPWSYITERSHNPTETCQKNALPPILRPVRCKVQVFSCRPRRLSESNPVKTCSYDAV